MNNAVHSTPLTLSLSHFSHSLKMRRLSLLLMTLGFGLLLAFVYLFLKKVWEEEVDNLKQQTNLLLVMQRT